MFPNNRGFFSFHCSATGGFWTRVQIWPLVLLHVPRILRGGAAFDFIKFRHSAIQTSCVTLRSYAVTQLLLVFLRCDFLRKIAYLYYILYYIYYNIYNIIYNNT